MPKIIVEQLSQLIIGWVHVLFGIFVMLLLTWLDYEIQWLNDREPILVLIGTIVVFGLFCSGVHCLVLTDRFFEELEREEDEK